MAAEAILLLWGFTRGLPPLSFRSCAPQVRQRSPALHQTILRWDMCGTSLWMYCIWQALKGRSAGKGCPCFPKPLHFTFAKSPILHSFWDREYSSQREQCYSPCWMPQKPTLPPRMSQGNEGVPQTEDPGEQELGFTGLPPPEYIHSEKVMIKVLEVSIFNAAEGGQEIKHKSDPHRKQASCSSHL